MQTRTQLAVTRYNVGWYVITHHWAAEFMPQLMLTVTLFGALVISLPTIAIGQLWWLSIIVGNLLHLTTLWQIEQHAGLLEQWAIHQSSFGTLLILKWIRLWGLQLMPLMACGMIIFAPTLPILNGSLLLGVLSLLVLTLSLVMNQHQHFTALSLLLALPLVLPLLLGTMYPQLGLLTPLLLIGWLLILIPLCTGISTMLLKNTLSMRTTIIK